MAAILLLGIAGVLRVLAYWWRRQIVGNVGRKLVRCRATPNEIVINGEEIGYQLLRYVGLKDVRIGTSSQNIDAYHPHERILFMSFETLSKPSVAAMAIVAHEVGHAWRWAKNPAIAAAELNVGGVSKVALALSYIGFFLGLAFSYHPLVGASVILALPQVLSQLLATIMEIDASHTALKLLRRTKFAVAEEPEIKDLLAAALLTYVVNLLKRLCLPIFFAGVLGLVW